MSGSSRVTEKWLNRGLWAIAFIFASFLIGLGGLVVGDLPQVQTAPVMETYLDKVAYAEVKQVIATKEKVIAAANKEVEVESVKLEKMNGDYRNAKEIFNTWLASRQTTQDQDQNPEVLAKTKDLEKQKNAIRDQEQKSTLKYADIQKLEDDVSIDRKKLSELEQDANEKVYQENRRNEVKVFLYRLALTLPLLLIAAWLFIKKRKTKNWPFVWGFVIFALFAFFVELVPYLPSYGGYIRYIVGIVLTLVIGQYSIKALQTYLEKQKKAEEMPNTQLKEKLNYDLAQQRLSRGICPGCERPIDLKDSARNFCVHCGTCVFNHCVKCNTRKNAFAKFCHSCGELG